MPKGYWFFSALFNCLDGVVNMIAYPFNRNIEISIEYQKWVYKRQKTHFELEIE
jgi:hypothetical protein